MTNKAWVLRLDHRYDISKRENVVGLGWVHATDLDQIKDWEAFKAALRNAYPNYAESEHALGNVAGSAWRFIHEMHEGDLVAVPVPDGFEVARIEGKVRHEPDKVQEDYGWRRNVTWLTDRPKPRSFAKSNLQRRLKARQTCVRASDLQEEIEASLKRREPVEHVQEFYETAREPLTRVLLDSLNDIALEKVICRLVEADGATARIPTKNNPGLGDVDVEARYRLFGPTGPEHVVLFQIKQHSGSTSAHAMKQLIEVASAIEDEKPSLCVVTTASAIDPDAQKLAGEHGIQVLKIGDLLQWILSAGVDVLHD